MQDKIFYIVRMAVFVILTPILYATAYSFCEHMSLLNFGSRSTILIGIAAYITSHLFVYKPVGFFKFGQRLCSDIFKFNARLSEFAKYLPIYTIVGLLILYFGSMVKLGDFIYESLLFMVGLTFAMHICLTAEEANPGDGKLFKPDYYLTMTVVFVVNVFLVILLMQLTMPEIRFSEFFKLMGETAREIYKGSYQALFQI